MLPNTMTKRLWRRAAKMSVLLFVALAVNAFIPAADQKPAAKVDPPYPPSKLITGIKWAPVSSIVRKARGSDNWPLTWADDDMQYGAYGDVNGFEPQLDVKLSMGLARISGPADKFTAENIRAPTF